MKKSLILFLLLPSFLYAQDDLLAELEKDSEKETEYVFAQSGNGNNGGFNHDLSYEWTPAIVNHQYFGVRIDSYPLSGKGSVVINYDLVEVTVQYSLPEVTTQ